MAFNITVTFAALTFPGKKSKATDEPVALSNLCVGQTDPHDPSPVRAPRTCGVCGPLPSHGDHGIVKGVQEGTGTYRVLNADDLTEAADKFARQYLKVIELVPHPAEEFLAVTAPGKSLNYLTPNGTAGANQYQALVKLIQAHPELVFVGLHTPQSVTHLYRVRVHKGVLVMEERVREDSLRQVPEVAGEINDQMFGMLDAFLPNLVTDYKAADYEDSYAKALEDIQARAAIVSVAGATEEVRPASSDNAVIELLGHQMDKIAAQAKAKAKAPAKKTAAARKTAAKKTTRRKVPA